MELPDDASIALMQVLLPVLKKFQVEVIAVGGLAVAHYGHKRISGGPVKGDIKADLDFWYKPTTDNYINLLKALKELGIDTSEIERKPFDPKASFLKIPHKTFHTDFLPQLSGLESFNKSKKDCSTLTIGELQLDIISFNDLSKNKEAVNREIDKADLEALRKKQQNSMGLGM